jgi:hypothetical protein
MLQCNNCFRLESKVKIGPGGIARTANGVVARVLCDECRAAAPNKPCRRANCLFRVSCLVAPVEGCERRIE